MARTNDNDSSSDEDLVRAINTSRKRCKTAAKQQATHQHGNTSGSTCWTKPANHVYNNSSQPQQHQRGVLLPDIDFEDNRRDPQSATTEGDEEASQNEDTSDILGNSRRSRPYNSRRAYITPAEPERQDKKDTKVQDELEKELRRTQAAQEALLLVLDDCLSSMPPTVCNTWIHMYAEHFELAISRLDQNAKESKQTSASGNPGLRHSAAKLLHSKLSASRHDLDEQLKHIRKSLWPMLGDESVLAYTNSTDRVTTRKYVLKFETYDEQQDDLSRLGRTPPKKRYEFNELKEATAYLEKAVRNQDKINTKCTCQPLKSKSSTEKNKKRKRVGSICYIRKYKRTGDHVPYQLACYELFHCSNYYIYWYIDVEVNWRTEQDADEKDKKFLKKVAQGIEAKKHRSTNVWVVTGNLLKAAREDTACSSTPLSATKMTRLPTSVWKNPLLANAHAAELFVCASRVQEAVRDRNDEIAWETWIKPVMHQTWARLTEHKGRLFECTVDIPDIMKDRHGYDAVTVQVEYVGSLSTELEMSNT